MATGPAEPTKDAVSRRESEVLAELATRQTNAEIAARLFISERTVESHISSLLRKLGAANRLELGALAVELARGARRELPGPLGQLAGSGPFVGRQGATTVLDGLRSRASRGSFLAAVVTGEAGIGKSRLVAEACAVASADDWEVVWGTALEDATTPYQVLAMALDSAIAVAGTEAWEAIGPLGPLVRQSLQIPAPLNDETAGSRVTGGDRTALALGVHRFLAAYAHYRRLIVVLEDLHWATPTTLQLLADVIRLGGSARVLVVATCRVTPPNDHAALRRFLADASALPAVTTLELGPISADESKEFIAAIAPTRDAARISQDARGNPLFIQELARAGTGSRVLRHLIERRDDELDVRARAALDAAAVLGSVFHVSSVARITDRPVDDVVVDLEGAEALGVVTHIGDPAGTFAFSHPLMRSVRYAALPFAQRLRLHHRVALDLERLGEGVDVGELARHACIAAPLGDAGRAVERSIEASRLCARSFAFGEAITYLQRAIEVASQHPVPPRLRLAANVHLGAMMVRAGDSTGREVLRAAARTATEERWFATLAEIAWGMVQDGSPTVTPGSLDPELVTIAESALAGLDDAERAARVKVLSVLAGHYAVGADPAHGYRLAEQAVALARGLGDPTMLGHALIAWRYAGGLPMRPDGLLAVGTELLALGRTTGDLAFRSFGWSAIVFGRRSSGDLAESGEALAAMREEFRELDSVYSHLLIELATGTEQLLLGDLAGAERSVSAAAALETKSGAPERRLAGPLLIAVVHARDQLAPVVALLEASSAAQPGFRGAYDAIRCCALVGAGRLGEAAALLEDHASDGFARVVPNLSMTTGLALFAEAAMLLGHDRAGNLLSQRLAPWGGLLADSGAAAFTSIDLARAHASLAAGDHESAAEIASAATKASRRRHTPILLGRELVALAAARRAVGSSDRALDEARTLATTTGAAIIERDGRHLGLWR